MTVDPFLFYSFIAVFIFALITCIAALWYISKLLSREKEVIELEDQSNKQYRLILKHAQARARQMLNKSNDDAEKLLEETEKIDEAIKVELDNTLRSIIEDCVELLQKDSEQFLSSHQSTLEQIRAKYLETVQQAVESVKTSTEGELKDYLQVVKKETIDAQETIGEQINEEFQKTQQEIQNYKKDKLAKIDQSLQKLLEQVVVEVIGKGISLKDHEQLILDALNKAKEEGALT